MVDSIEYNEVKIAGVRPGADMDSLRVYPKQSELYTQVVQRNTVENQTSSIYTVGSGEILHLCNITVWAWNTSGGPLEGRVEIFDDGASWVYDIFRGDILNNTIREANIVFSLPMELPEDWGIQGYSEGADLKLFLSFFGYLSS